MEALRDSLPPKILNALISIPLYTPAWELADKLAEAKGLALSGDVHNKIAILAASLAIQSNREPTMEDVLTAISVALKD